MSRSISSMLVIFKNITDDKDREASIDYTVKKGSQIIGQLSVGGGTIWPNNSTQGENWPIPISGATEDDRPKIVINITKRDDDAGFGCKEVDFLVKLDDGTTEQWHKFEGDFQMGDGHPNSQDTSLAS